jgi:hypothetical protein
MIVFSTVDGHKKKENMNFVSDANELNIEKEVLTIWFIKSIPVAHETDFQRVQQLQIGFDALWWNTASERISH